MKNKISFKLKKKISIITQGINEIINVNELIKKIIISEKKKKPLKIKFGIDPTSSSLHFGHLIILNKLLQFQKLGYIIYLIIGDFTSSIGDPSGLNISRPILNFNEILYNSKKCIYQIKKILDNKKLKIYFNSEWFNSLNIKNIFNLISNFTLMNIIERNDFKNRIKNKNSIFIHELLYPIMQGYDSLILKSDIEIGGSDQKFNLLIGRKLQKKFNKNFQIILTMPLLEGLDNINKMSKSKNNTINLNDHTNIIFYKIMNISNDMMYKYYKLILIYSDNKIKNIYKKYKNNKKKKINLAFKIIKKFYSLKKAKKSLKNFILFLKKKKKIYFKFNKNPYKIIKILKKINLCKSFLDAKRIINQNGIKINNYIIKNEKILIYSSNFFLQKGKYNLIKIKIL